MARYAFPDVVVSLGGSSVPDVTVVGDFDVNPILEEVTPVGSAPQTYAYVGVYGAGEITLEAPYSTTAGDLQPVIMTAGKGCTLAVIITWGGTKTSSFSAIVCPAVSSLPA